jgi:transposase
VIELRTGTKIWLAAGVTDMRRGFDGLSAKVQTVLNSSRSPDTSSFSAAAEATSSSFCGGTVMGYVCFPSVWSEGDSSGRRLRKELFV